MLEGLMVSCEVLICSVTHLGRNNDVCNPILGYE